MEIKNLLQIGEHRSGDANFLNLVAAFISSRLCFTLLRCCGCCCWCTYHEQIQYATIGVAQHQWRHPQFEAYSLPIWPISSLQADSEPPFFFAFGFQAILFISVSLSHSQDSQSLLWHSTLHSPAIHPPLFALPNLSNIPHRITAVARSTTENRRVQRSSKAGGCIRSKHGLITPPGVIQQWRRAGVEARTIKPRSRKLKGSGRGSGQAGEEKGAAATSTSR